MGLVKRSLYFSVGPIIFALIFFAYGGLELYRVDKFVVDQCQVRSIDIIEDDDMYRTRWNLKVIHGHEEIDGHIISSTGSSIKPLARVFASNYKVGCS